MLSSTKLAALTYRVKNAQRTLKPKELELIQAEEKKCLKPMAGKTNVWSLYDWHHLNNQYQSLRALISMINISVNMSKTIAIAYICMCISTLATTKPRHLSHSISSRKVPSEPSFTRPFTTTVEGNIRAICNYIIFLL